jgi:hypothetical protein
MCNVDLFPVPTSELADKSTIDTQQQRPDASSSNHMDYASSTPSPYSLAQPHHFSYPPTSVYSGQQNSMPMPPPPLQVPQHAIPGYTTGPNSLEIIAQVGNHSITEDSKCTKALVGKTFVQPENIDYKGKKSLMFVFAVGGPYCAHVHVLSLIFKSDIGPGGEDRGYIHPPLSCL